MIECLVVGIGGFIGAICRYLMGLVPIKVTFLNTMIINIIGAMVIAVLNNGLNLLHVSTYAQQIALGIVIIGAVYVDVLRERLGSKAKKN